MNATRLFCCSSVAALLALGGCRVSSHEHGKNNDVDIGTPFGSMHVKTNDAANLSGLGLTPYPGAAPYSDSDDRDGKHDKDAADIHMNFGDFHLGVKAASFFSHDTQDDILAFYRKDLARYGDVIQCKGTAAVGAPDHTAQGLRCDENDNPKHGRMHTGSGVELRAGSPQHQHIVGIDSKDDGYKIGLVALDLPGHFGKHKDSEGE